MNWNGVSNDERLCLWKNLRNNLKGVEFEDQLKEIAKFYAATPFGSRSVDYYSPDEWPTPWEILFYGTFCISSISLLIFYTIQLTSDNHKVDLYLVDDDSDVFLLPVIDDRFVLNYQHGVVSNYSDIKDEFKIIKITTQDQVKAIV